MYKTAFWATLKGIGPFVTYCWGLGSMNFVTAGECIQDANRSTPRVVREPAVTGPRVAKKRASDERGTVGASMTTDIMTPYT